MHVEGLPESRALRAVDAAFAEVAHVHRLMSFHAADSDISRLHAATPGTALAVDARTWEVLRIAEDISVASCDIFDVTIASRLVACGRLPRPVSPYTPDPQATWRDIERLDDMRVQLHRPLWLDLSGIAKGYAVDRAITIVRQAGASQAMVNAGGDMRCFGARWEPVHLRLDSERVHVPLLELSNAAVATSARDVHLRADQPGDHVHGVTRDSSRGAASVSVVAAQCVIADALTKVVLAGDAAVTRQVLARFAAQAGMLGPTGRWRTLDRAA